MAAKRIWITLALAVVCASTGCRSWCEHHYPCAAAAPACNPCCSPAASYAPPPVAAPAPNWNAQAGAGRPCTCVCP